MFNLFDIDNSKNGGNGNQNQQPPVDLFGVAKNQAPASASRSLFSPNGHAGGRIIDDVNRRNELATLTNTRGSAWMNRYRSIGFTMLAFQVIDELPDIRRRSMNFMPTREGVEALETAITRDRGVNRIGIAPAVGSMLYLDNPAEICRINGGWGTQRVRFVLTVVLYPKATDGVAEYMIVCGYSDPFEGVSWRTRSVDPQMTLYVSHIHRFNMSRQNMTPLNLLDSNVIMSAPWANGMLDTNNTLSMLRPADVASNTDAMSSFNQFTGGPGVETLIAVNRLGNMPDQCKFADASPTAWMGSLLSAHADSANMAKMGSFTGDDGLSHQNNVERLLSGGGIEWSASRNPFIHAISNLDVGGISKSTFCINDLIRLDPEVANNIQTELIGNEKFGRVGFISDSEDPNEVAEEARVAQTIAKAIGDPMVTATLCHLTFVWMSGTEPVIQNAQSLLASFDFSPLLDALKIKITREVMANALSMPGSGYQHYAEIAVTADLMGITAVTIKLDGMDIPRVYCYPTVMEAVTTSLVTSDHDRAKEFYANVNSVATGLF